MAIEKILGDWKQLLGFLSLLCAAAWLVQTFAAWYRLRHFKGPFPASISRLWLMRAVSGGRMHLDFWEANKKYGMCFRFRRDTRTVAIV
jgi:hypothetical protein